MYNLIGVKTTHPTDEDLEEQIVIKSIKDFYTSKFTEEDHQAILNIIYDVFPSAIPAAISNNVNNS